jgi:hypothetical protein
VESGRRYVTIVPQQALFLMNSPMVIEAARKLVDRPIFAEIDSDRRRVTALYLAIYQRMPTQEEIALGLKYVQANPAGTRVEVADESSTSPTPAKEAPARRPNGKRVMGKFNTQVGGVYQTHARLDAWTKLAHALFVSNEAIFYD